MSIFFAAATRLFRMCHRMRFGGLCIMVPDVRMRGFRDRADVEEVIRLLDTTVATLSSETVSLADGSGRILAADVVSEVNVPGFDRAAMDGFALRGSETFGAGSYNPLEFTIVGESFPGRPFSGTVNPGQAIRIMTGAPVPAGADAVLQAEAAEEREGKVGITDAVPPGRHIGHIGEDISAGTVILKAGRQLRPQDLGVLASIGKGQISVVRLPAVSVIITGNELLPCGATPEGYRIVDSNSVMLDALIRRDGAESSIAPLQPDTFDAIRFALLGELERGIDMVLISGGSSVGQEDHAPRVVALEGELLIHGVALRPASPTGVGFVRGKPVFLMPGNPVSCLCAYDLFAGRLVRRLGGRSPEMPHRTLTLPLGHKLASAIGRVDYVRVAVREGLVEPMATSGASILSSTTRADGFVLVPRDSESYPPGENVRVYLYD
jgi:molybdopterin molybdotransferase